MTKTEIIKEYLSIEGNKIKVNSEQEKHKE